MTEERAPYAVPAPQPCRPADDADRRMWLMIRRGLLLIVKGIEVKYGNESTKERNAA